MRKCYSVDTGHSIPLAKEYHIPYDRLPPSFPWVFISHSSPVSPTPLILIRYVILLSKSILPHPIIQLRLNQSLPIQFNEMTQKEMQKAVA